MKFILLFILLFSGVVSSFGQKFGIMTNEEKKAFEKQALGKIDELDFRFQKITDLINHPDIQKDLIESTLRDFDPEATIMVISPSNNRTLKINEYLYDKVAKYKNRYSIVAVNFISFEIEKIKRDPKNPRQYIIEFSFLQRWCANKDGLPKRNAEGLLIYSYCDITEKSGKFIIKKITDSGGSRWKLFYSSIDAELKSFETN